MPPQQVGIESYNIQHIIVLFVFSSLAIVAVILRFWSRRIQRLTLEWNDYLIIPGLILAVAESYFAIYACYFGRRRETTIHQSLEAQEAVETLANKAIFVDPILWVIAVTCIRSSILLLYLRLFRTRSFRIACYCVLGPNLVYPVTTILADCFICRPLAYRWDRSLSGHCGKQMSLDLYIGILNFLFDAIIVVLPMPIVWHLQMARKRKVILSGIFGMGIGICGLTLYRLYTTVSIDPNDWVHGYAVVILVTCLEALLGIINACLPALGPLVHKLGAFTSRKSNDVISMISRGNNSSPMHGKPKQRQTSNNYFTIGDETSSIQTSAWPKDQTSNASAVHHLDIARDGSDTPEHTTRPPSENELPGIHVRSDVNVDITAVVGKSWDGYSGNW